jgi:hypothetical protein
MILSDLEDTLAKPQVIKTTKNFTFADKTWKHSNDSIAEKVEKERLQQLQTSAEKLKNRLKQVGRCGICTLYPPCKHVMFDVD